MSTCRRLDGTVAKHPGNNSAFPRQLSKKVSQQLDAALISWPSSLATRMTKSRLGCRILFVSARPCAVAILMENAIANPEGPIIETL